MEITTDMKMNSLLTRKLAIGGALGLIVIALIVAAIRPRKSSGSGPGTPPDVAVAQVEQRDVPIYREWIGTLEGYINADVRGQVTGYLLRQDYKEGALVTKNQLLFEIDPRPFQAVLDQAEGQLAQATAQLANAEAIQGRTQLDVERYTPLAREGRTRCDGHLPASVCCCSAAWCWRPAASRAGAPGRTCRWPRPRATPSS